MQDWVFRLGKKLQTFSNFWKQTFRAVNLRKSILFRLILSVLQHCNMTFTWIVIAFEEFRNEVIGLYTCECLFKGDFICLHLVRYDYSCCSSSNVLIRQRWASEWTPSTFLRRGFILFSWQPQMQLNSVTWTELRQFVIRSQNPPNHLKLASVLGNQAVNCGRQICFSLN